MHNGEYKQDLELTSTCEKRTKTKELKRYNEPENEPTGTKIWQDTKFMRLHINFELTHVVNIFTLMKLIGQHGELSSKQHRCRHLKQRWQSSKYAHEQKKKNSSIRVSSESSKNNSLIIPWFLEPVLTKSHQQTEHVCKRCKPKGKLSCGGLFVAHNGMSNVQIKLQAKRAEN